MLSVSDFCFVINENKAIFSWPTTPPPKTYFQWRAFVGTFSKETKTRNVFIFKHTKLWFLTQMLYTEHQMAYKQYQTYLCYES